MRRGGISEEQIRKVTYAQPAGGLRPERPDQRGDWLNPPAIDQRTLYMGNSVLRGGQAPRVEHSREPAAGEDLANLKIV